MFALRRSMLLELQGYGALALKVCCAAFQIFSQGTERHMDLTWDELKKEVTLAVESEVRCPPSPTPCFVLMFVVCIVMVQLK